MNFIPVFRVKFGLQYDSIVTILVNHILASICLLPFDLAFWKWWNGLRLGVADLLAS